MNEIKPIALSVLIFIVTFAAMRMAFPGGIMFYQGLLLSAVGGLIHTGWVIRAGRSPSIAAVKDGLLVFLLAYAFMFTIPTTVDRSYSVKLINALGQAPDGLQREQLESLFAVDFVRGGAVERRIDEQTKSGIVEQGDTGVRLTPLGRFIHRSFIVACRVFTCSGERKQG